jgi:dipeptidyl aminopeptidase/acylaminoacyl peptidase
MPIGKTQGWKVLQNDTPSYVILIEPPDADPHVRWCERERLTAAPYSIDYQVPGNLYFHIYVINADGSHLVSLTASTNHTGSDYFPVWSPDGSKIVFSSNRDGRDFKLYMMNPDGSQVLKLFDYGYRASFSPDGKKIAFNDQDFNGIRIMNADVTDIVNLVNCDNKCYDVSWAPYGNSSNH